MQVTTPPIGGFYLEEGQSFTANIPVPGADPTMSVTVTPQTFPATGPGDGLVWQGYVSAPGLVTVKIQAITGGFFPPVVYNLNLTSNATSGNTVTFYLPVLAFGGSSAGINYHDQNGNWSRVGQFVICSIYMTLNSKGAATGLATVSLPVPAFPGSFFGVGTVLYNNMTAVTGSINTSVNGSVLQMYYSSLIGVTDVDFLNNTNLLINLSYQAAS